MPANRAPALAASIALALLAVLTPGSPAHVTASPAAACPTSTGGAFAHVHASGKWSYGVRTAGKSVERASRERQRLRADAASYRAAASIVTHTEMMNGTHAGAILGGAGECWSSYLPAPAHNDGKDETAIEWSSVWSARAKSVVKLTDRRIRTRQLYASVVRLRERLDGRLGRTVIVMATHLPSDVEGRWSTDDTKVLAHKSALAGWRRLVNRFRERYPTASFVVAADWNLDHKKAWVRRELGRRLGNGLTSAWPASYDSIGTHGHRLIDADWRRGLEVRRAAVRGDVVSSDHRPHEVRYLFR
ncbi:hypothetical protein [Nocardioides speluncae]|uniref:hypothetical protein n=1 Tax=Nocardioides speluncae TaxID=2670337 RepID=UPI000D68F7B3|nr:hypothetical protein [Nocardioides speluncae]